LVIFVTDKPTNQHRATPEQWEYQERWASDDDDASCILELRCRVEALEATQHAHADLSRLSDAEREQVTQELAKPVRVFTAKEVAPIVAPATRARFISEVFQAASAEVRPAAGLVERIEAVAGGDARAAIREVAKWLRDRYPKSPEAGAVAFNLCQEADRG
jgi:hypothetical protein